MEFPSMSSVEGSPARTSASPGKVRALKEAALAYGQSTPDLLANYDPITSSWRTSQRCLVEGWTLFSETWPRSGLMRNGIAYQLPPLVPLTAATDSGLWPTPDAMVANLHESVESVLERRERIKATGINGNGFGLRLQTAVKMWQTPVSDDAVERTAGKYNSRGEPKLSAQVKLWPTPRANDAEKRGNIANDIRNGLPAAAKYWAMPVARDARTFRGAARAPNALGSEPLSVQVSQQEQATDGALNPTWVEWLMGFPLGWTALEGWGMRSSRKSRS
jgi:hypothetical protein